MAVKRRLWVLVSLSLVDRVSTGDCLVLCHDHAGEGAARDREWEAVCVQHYLGRLSMCVEAPGAETVTV